MTVLVMFAIQGRCAAAPAKSDTLRLGGPSVRTNLVWLAASEPNLGLEIPLSPRLTIGANAGLKRWPRFLPWDMEMTENTRHWRNFAIVPELRFWPDRSYEGWFTGLDLVYTHFNVGNVRFPFGLYPAVRDHRLQGDFYGAGLFTGYSWWLGDRWRLEAEAGLAAGYTDAGVFNCDHCSERVDVRQGMALVPKVGLNLAYNIRRREKRQEIVQIIREIEKPVPPAEVEKPLAQEMPLMEVPDYMGRAGELAPHHPVLRPTSEYQPYTPDRILRKEEGALYVFFELDKSVLKRTFSEGSYSRDNGPVLDEIMDLTAQILADTTGSRITGLRSCAKGFADAFAVSDSTFRFDAPPVVRAGKVPDTPGRWCLATVNFPSRDSATRSEGGDALWEVDVFARCASGSVTKTVLGFNQPLPAGHLKIIKLKVNPDGSVIPSDSAVGLNVTLNWNTGYTGDVDL